MNHPAPVAWITHRECLLHDMGADHPECPRRLQVIEDRLVARGLDGFLQRYEAPAATVEQLRRVHDADYIARILTTQTGSEPFYIDADTAMNAHTARAALHAAGAGILAVDLVLQHGASLAFCAVRPPGHHAERAQAMGFCFFNNVAVAAAHALASGLPRVAVLDFDVHYGNGTVHLLGGDPRVRVCSIYQQGHYPHWVGGAELGNLVDVPLLAYDGSTAFRKAISDHWLPELERFRPALLLVSAGFDAHAQDPLGDLTLSSEDYEWIGGKIAYCAARHCGGRVVATLEGGYSLMVLGRCVEAFLQPFLGMGGG